MKDRLPVYLENLELPKDNLSQVKRKANSYGYVSVLLLLSTLITLSSLIVILIFGNR